MNLTRILPIAGIILISGCSLFQRENPEISRKELKEHLNYLASEELKGRYPGTPGDKKAAAYITENLKNAGLTLADRGGRQQFTVNTGQKPGKDNHLQFGDFEGTLNEDFVPMPFSGNGKLTAEIVFVGYGFQVDAKSFQWNDYANAAIQNKWVMILRGTPDNEDLKKFFMGQRSDREKALTAKDNGAGGILFLSAEEGNKKDKLSYSG